MSEDSVPASAAVLSSPSHSGAPADVTSTLLKLLNSFPAALYPPHTPIQSLPSLASGLCLFHFLHSLEPQHFDLDPLQTSADDADSRRANLQYLLDCLETFFEEAMQKTMDLAFLDVGKLSGGGGEDETNAQLLSLLELVLLCAINSTKKDAVIEVIMAMTDSEQQTLMNVISEVQSRADKDHLHTTGSPIDLNLSGLKTPPRKESFDPEGSTPPASSTSMSTSAGINSAVAASSTASSAAVADLTKQLAQSQSFREDLTKQLDAANREVREWKKKAHEIQERADQAAAAAAAELQRSISSTSESTERAVAERSKNELARLQKELARSENRERELEQQGKSSQEQVLLLQRELVKSQEQTESVSREVQALKDELQVASEKVEELNSLQVRMEKMKTRLSAFDDLKASSTALEAENSKQLDRIIELENEAKEIDSLKAQLTRMKDAAFTAESTLLDKTLALEQATSELSELKETLEVQKQEWKGREQEWKREKQEWEKEKMQSGASSAASNRIGSDDLTDSSSNASASASGEDPKLTIRRLEFELNKLRNAATAASSDGDSSELSLLRQQKDSLQEKYLESQRKLASMKTEHQKQVKELQEQSTKEKGQWEEEKERMQTDKTEAEERKRVLDQKNEELSAMRQELSELHEQLEATRTAAGTAAGASAADATPKSPTASKPASTSSSPSTSAEVESLSLRNKKLEAYIKQTQRKYKALEEQHEATQKQLAETHGAYKTARQQLIDREREIVEREKSRQGDTANAVRERKLLSSAFYSMGMEFQAAIMAGRAVTKTGHADDRREVLAVAAAGECGQSGVERKADALCVRGA